MSTIVLRTTKGSALTNTEVDNNFSNLNTDKLQLGGTYSSGTANGVTYLNGSKVLTTGSALTFDGTNLGIGTPSPVASLDIQNSTSVNQLRLQTNKTNSTNKSSAIITGHYTNSEEGLLTVGGFSTSTEGVVYLGGGYGTANAATTVLFFTAANNTTTTGIERLRIASNGDISFYEDTGTTAKFFWDASAESLGIGTSSPAVKLHASGSSTYVAGIEGSSASAYLGLRASGSGGSMADPTVGVGANVNDLVFRAGGAARMRLDSSGNLGLGVTPSAWDTVYQAIQLPNGGTLAGYKGSVAPIINLGSNVYYNSGNKYVIAGVASQYLQNQGVHSWHTAPSWDGTGDNTIAFNQAMTLDASGNLLVGTTSLYGGEKLALVQSTNNRGFVIQQTNASNTSPPFLIDCSRNTTNETYNALAYYNSGAGAYRFYVTDNGGGYFNGNVGIGTTGISSRLHVVTTAPTITTMESTAANGGYLTFSNGSTVPLYIGFGSTLTTGLSTSDAALRYSNNLVFSSGSAEKMRIDSSGNVGIGTTSGHGSKVAIRTTGANQTALRLDSAANNPENYIALDFGLQGIALSTGYGAFIRGYNYGNNDYRGFLTFGTSAAGGGGTVERARIDHSGQVLIGNTTAALGTGFANRKGRLHVGDANGLGGFGAIGKVASGNSATFVVINNASYRVTVYSTNDSTSARIGQYIFIGLNSVVQNPTVLTVATTGSPNWTFSFSVANTNDTLVTVAASSDNQGTRIIVEQLGDA
jgi:hypothetical protein